jgi:hypothetical protein
MDAEDLRALAQRSRELLRVATAPEIKAQLRDWIEDFEAEAEATGGDAPATAFGNPPKRPMGRPDEKRVVPSGPHH